MAVRHDAPATSLADMRMASVWPRNLVRSLDAPQMPAESRPGQHRRRSRHETIAWNVNDGVVPVIVQTSCMNRPLT